MEDLKKCVETEALSPQFPYMPKNEWEGRVKKAKGLMEEKGIDALLLFGRKSQVYYFGYVKPYPFQFPGAGIVPREGPTTFITEILGTNTLQLKGYAERALKYRGDTRAPTPIAPDPVKALAELIEDLGLANKKIAVDKGPFSWWGMNFTLGEWEMLSKLLPKVKWADAMEEVVLPQTNIKTRWEQDVMRKLAYTVAKGYSKAISVAAPGVNEKDVWHAMLNEWIKEGIVDSIWETYTVQTSRNVATSFYEDHVLEPGDYIFMDCGPSYKEYQCDCQRMIWIGSPSQLEQKFPGFKKKSYAAEQTHIEVEDMMKPGTELGDIWQKGHEILCKYLGEEYWKVIRSPSWIGWVGHNQGLYMHQPPYIVEGETSVLKPGQIVCIEFPVLDLEKGVFINMPEDIYLITERGHECLTEMLGPKGVYIKY